jgi:hypothetical protein
MTKEILNSNFAEDRFINIDVRVIFGVVWNGNAPGLARAGNRDQAGRGFPVPENSDGFPLLNSMHKFAKVRFYLGD